VHGEGWCNEAKYCEFSALDLLMRTRTIALGVLVIVVSAALVTTAGADRRAVVALLILLTVGGVWCAAGAAMLWAARRENDPVAERYAMRAVFFGIPGLIWWLGFRRGRRHRG
jgi:hypothetical protein